ncbi:MAG: thiolase family protein [Actinophytocola sp.]|nr:thiolase family protein [Actinophytocola sp.]
MIETRQPPECRAIFSGIGQSAVGRRLGRSAIELTLDACLSAIEDAGLERSEIDGIASYPGAMAGMEAFSGPGTPEVQDALRLRLNWHGAGAEGPGQLAAVVNASLAIGAGLARHVLIYRTVTEATAQGSGGRGGIGLSGSSAGRIGGSMQWMLPFGAYSPANWLAMYAQLHFHTYGTTREQLGQIALNGRRHAALNPQAIYRDPLTMEDYLNARMISTPLCLYDCDVPADGSVAVVLSDIDTVTDLRAHPVHIDAVGTAIHGRPSWDQWDDLTTTACRDAAAQLWSRTDLRPQDVDTAQLYDGFSFLTLAWLEALGFCDKGESGAFVAGGERIGRDGELPLNTSGGQLSAGRLHGYGHLHEAVLQLRGDAGERQVPGAEVAIAAAGGGPIAGVVLLTR